MRTDSVVPISTEEKKQSNLIRKVLSGKLCDQIAKLDEIGRANVAERNIKISCDSIYNLIRGVDVSRDKRLYLANKAVDQCSDLIKKLNMI